MLLGRFDRLVDRDLVVGWLVGRSTGWFVGFGLSESCVGAYAHVAITQKYSSEKLFYKLVQTYT